MKRILAALAGAMLLGPGAALAQRTTVISDFPIYDNGGKPDFTIDPKRFTSQMEMGRRSRFTWPGKRPGLARSTPSDRRPAAP